MVPSGLEKPVNVAITFFLNIFQHVFVQNLPGFPLHAG